MLKNIQSAGRYKLNTRLGHKRAIERLESCRGDVNL
jgi:hypothetical protein